MIRAVYRASQECFLLGARQQRRWAFRTLRFGTLIASIGALGACGTFAQQTPGTLAVRSAQIHSTQDGVTIDLGIDCHLSGPMQDALDHGIALTLQLDIRAGRWPTATSISRHVELRYFPLSRRYQLNDVESGDVRSFATPSYLVAALGALRFDLPRAFAALPAETPVRVSAALDAASLPGALRLPALFEPAWKFAATDYSWRTP